MQFFKPNDLDSACLRNIECSKHRKKIVYDWLRKCSERKSQIPLNFLLATSLALKISGLESCLNLTFTFTKYANKFGIHFHFQSTKTTTARTFPHMKRSPNFTPGQGSSDPSSSSGKIEISPFAPIPTRPISSNPISFSLACRPSGVGRNELKRRLLELDPSKYGTTIPYTSRPMRPGEVDGKDYWFVTRERMEEEIGQGKFIEFGEYKGNLYGTASASVRAVMEGGQVAVLNPHSQAIKMLRTVEFKPFIIYIKPPEFEVLKQSRHNAFAKSTFDETSSRAFNVRNGSRCSLLVSPSFPFSLFPVGAACLLSFLISVERQ